ncbi:MAG: hypothetical protein KDH48_24240, partial [Rhodoferax sp.]|nr:hypothetical protein [Rhodoferax sp.]
MMPARGRGSNQPAAPDATTTATTSTHEPGRGCRRRRRAAAIGGVVIVDHPRRALDGRLAGLDGRDGHLRP